MATFVPLEKGRKKIKSNWFIVIKLILYAFLRYIFPFLLILPNLFRFST